jgi:hypothetical protein
MNWEETEMTEINWLHFSDLHQGLDPKWLWPRVRHALYSDLEGLFERSGPWDLVFFTGDLTQRGTKAEFDDVTKTLLDLWSFFERLGRPTPRLVVVPGNHDLVRPTDLPRLGLAGWSKKKEEEVHGSLRAFWIDEVKRRHIEEWFKNYSEWIRRPELPFLWSTDGFPKDGLLPGDFALDFEKNGLTLGLVGLNGTFLQLDGGREVPSYQRKLDLVGADQLDAITKRDAKWCENRDLCFLLTHHPADWFCPRAGFVEVARPGRFALHLYGHNHRARMRTFIDSDSGGHEQREFLGASLLGLESLESGGERLHGYSAGQLKVDSGRSRIRFWPRRAKQNERGDWNIVADDDSFLHLDREATWPWEVPLNRGFELSLEEDDVSGPQPWGIDGPPVHWYYVKVTNPRYVALKHVRVSATVHKGRNIQTYDFLLWDRYRPGEGRPPAVVDLKPRETGYCRLGVLKKRDRIFCLDTSLLYGLKWEDQPDRFVGFVKQDEEMMLELVAEAESGVYTPPLRLTVRYNGGWSESRQEISSKRVLTFDRAPGATDW